MLQLNHISFSLAKTRADILDGIALKLEDNQIGCLLGPSGCGKTTMLRLIAGFLQPSLGSIKLDERTLCDIQQGKLVQSLPPEQRGIGMLFQDFALFPHLDVYSNIAFGLSHLNTQEKATRIKRYLALTRLSEYAHRKPRELSGGQQQRVALARALAPHPKLLLMDEPFSNLDTDLRRQLSHEVHTILKQEKISALLVTHDQQEAMQMADIIGVMHEGRLDQWAPAYEVYHEPVNRFVANFIGHGRFLLGTAQNNGYFATQLGPLQCMSQYKNGNNWAENSQVDILIRPDDLVVAQQGTPAMVTQKYFQGAYIHYWLCLNDGTVLEAFFSSHHDFQLGQWIILGVDAKHLVIFPKAGEQTAAKGPA